MAFLYNLFGRQPAAPERVPTDTVIPLFSHDDTRPFRSISLESTMIFDEALDADKLFDALWKLLERPGWRKLGARLRRNDKGKLEYHIPAEYTPSRPPVNYTHAVHHMPISQHPCSAQWPRKTGRLQASEAGDLNLVADEDCSTTKLEDWIYSDKAQLTLHIANFEDATCVAITWLHTLLDAMGQSALLRAWQAVLEGRDDDVPEFLGYDSDPLAGLGSLDSPKGEKSVLEPHRLGVFGMARFIFNYMWEPYWYPVEGMAILTIPASYLAKIKAEAFASLESLPPSKLTYNTFKSADEKPKPFLSDGDIMTAFHMRLIVSSNASLMNSPTRLVNLMNVLDMRDLLRNTSPPLLPKEGVLIHNATVAISTLITIQDLVCSPLGHVAARIRKDLVTQSTRAQLEATNRLANENGGIVLFGSGDVVIGSISNWTKAKLYETDFSAAIRKEARVGKTAQTRGRPRFIYAQGNADKLPLRGCGNVIGRDWDGDWWLGAILRKEYVAGYVKMVEGMA